MHFQQAAIVVKGVIQKDFESRAINDWDIGLSESINKETLHSLEICDIFHLSLYEFPDLPANQLATMPSDLHLTFLFLLVHGSPLVFRHKVMPLKLSCRTSTSRRLKKFQL
jgi:hypothetical protein